MRIRWRGLELPSRIHRDPNVNISDFGRFVIEPFEQGFGTTIGNSLRRVLLSSLEGAAVTTVRIAGVSHEFTTMTGVMEDVTDVILNIKRIVLRMEGDEPKTIRLRRNRAGEVRAGDIESDPSVTVINKDMKIATLTSNVTFDAEMTVKTGRGFATAGDHRAADMPLGVIPIDSVFSPVLRVRFRTEDMRVGQRTNYDRLILEIWTKGTILPEDALVEAALILRKHLNVFLMYHDLGDDEVTPMASFPIAVAPENAALTELLERPLSVLNLSVRASNCLDAAGLRSLGELVIMGEAEVLRLRSFGKTSLHEVQRKLAEMGLSLGMKFGAKASEGSRSESDLGMAESLRGHMSGAEDASLEGKPGPMEVFTMGD